MKAYSTLFDDVLPELPGADPAIVLHQIKRTVNDFYERSLFSRERIVANLVAGVATYVVGSSTPTDFDVGKVLDVRLNTGSSAGPQKMQPRTPQQLDIEMPNWDTQTGVPRYYTQSAIDTIVLVLIPNTSYVGGLIITISKLPTYAGIGYDDAVAEKFNEALGAGVKSRMMRMPKKPWSNPQLASQYGAFFDAEVGAAAIIAGRSYGRGRLRTRCYG